MSCANRSLRAIPSPTGSYCKLHCAQIYLTWLGTRYAYFHADLSASSSTRISMVLREKDGVLWRWSTSLPGVAIMTSGFLRSMASCPLLSRPPERGGRGRGKKERKKEKGRGGQSLTYNHTECQRTCQLALNTCTCTYIQLIREHIMLCETDILPAARQNSTLVCLAKAFPTEWIYIIKADTNVYLHLPGSNSTALPE